MIDHLRDKGLGVGPVCRVPPAVAIDVLRAQEAAEVGPPDLVDRDFTASRRDQLG